SYTLWVGLTEITEEMGTTGVLEGSHRFLKRIRYTPDEIFHKQKKHQIQVTEDDFKIIPLKAGQAILWDHSLIHHSMPNHSERDRINISFGLTQESADLKLYWAC